MNKTFILLSALLVFIYGVVSAEETERQRVFRDHVERIEQSLGGRLGVAVLNTGTGEFLGYRPDERFAMCSTFKFFLVSAVLNTADADPTLMSHAIPFDSTDLVSYSPVTGARVEDGVISVEEACAAAVIESDNTAANLLIELVGGPDAVTSFARSLGDAVTRVDRYEPELNSNRNGDEQDTTTPRAMVGSMEMVLVGDTLSPSSLELLLAWMSRTETGRNRIRAGIDPRWRIATKAGSGERGATNDIGIVWPPGEAAILIAVYSSESTKPPGERNAAIAAVARTAIATLRDR